MVGSSFGRCRGTVPKEQEERQGAQVQRVVDGFVALVVESDRVLWWLLFSLKHEMKSSAIRVRM